MLTHEFDNLNDLAQYIRTLAARARRRAQGAGERKRDVHLSEAYGLEQAAYVVETARLKTGS